jgi:hAT family C-terminal dimerisation region
MYASQKGIKLLFCNPDYCHISSLQSSATSTVTLKHNILYEHLYALITCLLTPLVTSASCKRAHSKVDIVKSAARARMTSERLEDLTLMSLEHAVLDKADLSVVTVSKFAAAARALPLYEVDCNM